MIRRGTALYPAALLALLAAAGCATEQAADRIPLNLDFSRPGLANPETPWGWWFLPMTGAGVEISVVDDAGGDGKALRLERLDPGPPVQGLYDLIEPFAGHRVAVEAPIRRAAGATATLRVGLVAYRDDGAPAEAFSPAGCDAAVSSREAVCRAALEVGSGTTGLQILLEYAGSGALTLSPLRLRRDGAPLTGPVLPDQVPPTAAEVAWARRHALDLYTTEPVPPFDDLTALRPLIADADFVLLGESTHGSREFFTLKHRIVRWLIEREGFTVFAIEDHAGAAAAIDRYLETGDGDVVALVEGLFGVWERREVLDMVRWMRQAVVAGTARIAFTGFDLQSPLGAVAELDAFAAAHDAALAELIETELGALRDAWLEGSYPQREPAEHQRWAEGAKRFLEAVTARRDDYRQRAGTEVAERARFNARLAWQSAELSRTGDSALRDRFMAENLSWIHDQQPPGSRIAVWAHNSHIRLDEDKMGRFLAARHPGRVVAIGLTTYQGTYTAYSGARMETYTLFPGPPESIEQILHRTGQPLLALDLRRLDDVDDGSAPFRSPRYHRNIGLFAADFGFYRATMAEAFDALLYVDRTTATRPLE